MFFQIFIKMQNIYSFLVDHRSNQVTVTHLEKTEIQGLHFSPCDEGAEILQSSTVELCVCHKLGDHCHKKRLVWNKNGKLEVTATVDALKHERIEAHFYTEEEMLIRTIKRVDDHHRHVHVTNDELKIGKMESKQYAKIHIQWYNHTAHGGTIHGLLDDYHTYLFEVEK